MIDWLFSLKTLTASASLAFTNACEFLIHFSSQASECLLSTSFRAGPTTRSVMEWHEVQFAVKRVFPSSADWANKLNLKVKENANRNVTLTRILKTFILRCFASADFSLKRAAI